jgi:hypothetical protein
MYVSLYVINLFLIAPLLTAHRRLLSEEPSYINCLNNYTLIQKNQEHVVYIMVALATGICC